jgi:hypothetical protein
MKKIIIILLFAPFIVKGQVTITWSDSVKVPVTDTVIFFNNSSYYYQDYSSFCWNCEFELSRLDSSVIINFGGGNSILSKTFKVYSFNPLVSDSLPYTVSRLSWKRTINGVAQNKKAFYSTKPFGWQTPEIYIKRSGATRGKWIPFTCKFYR